MQLTARISSPQALYRKLEREAYRAFHASTPLQKADHFFNFCVTASSMRDYCLEHLGAVTKLQKKPYHATWWKVPLLVAAIEIANSTKHFVLRDPGGNPAAFQTRASRMKRSRFVDVYVNDLGQHEIVPVTRTEITITLSDGKRLELFQFTRDVLEYWRAYLGSIGLRIRKQPFSNVASSAA
jgi:hypothetical protein